MSRALAAAASVLGLAAAPTFALMALATSLDGSPAVFCSAQPGRWPIDGMAAMYLLMSAFHLGPWLRLAGGRPAAD